MGTADAEGSAGFDSPGYRTVTRSTDPARTLPVRLVPLRSQLKEKLSGPQRCRNQARIRKESAGGEASRSAVWWTRWRSFFGLTVIPPGSNLCLPLVRLYPR